MAIETLAGLLVQTVDELSRRAPAIVAAAAHQLNGIVLGLHFGDGTEGALWAEHSRLVASSQKHAQPQVEVYFDDRAMKLLFDMERRPVMQVLEGSLDLRGERVDVLAVWRVFQLLSQRASGLRAVQTLWREYRDRQPRYWAREPAAAVNGALTPWGRTGWKALDFLDARHPEDADLTPSLIGGRLSRPARAIWSGKQSLAWWEIPPIGDSDLLETMNAAKNQVREEILRMIPEREPKAALYDLIREYPGREGKGLRPTLTLATCAALGGMTQDALRAAAAIELFHNGFLVHDDIADESTDRRSLPTLHASHGVGLAVNTGDAMNLLAVDGVLSNLSTLGLGRTLGLIHEIMHMCRETAEGQAIELGWIREVTVPELDEDYFNMSTKKTGWYTCISPCRMGAVCAGETDPKKLDLFNEAFRLIGIAFQIQDDLLNLVGETALYGKEALGDLLEGKRTVMMIHLFRTINGGRRERMLELIRVPRAQKSLADAEEMLAAMQQAGSLDYAADLADKLAHEGVRRFEQDLAFIPETESKGVLRQIANYVTTRPL